MCDSPCSYMCVHPRCPRAVQRMSRGCVGSMTQCGRWWDRTASQQRGMLLHHTQARFEYCIRALEMSPWTPLKALWNSTPALNPYSGVKAPWSFSLGWLDCSKAGGFRPDSSSVRFYREFLQAECESQFADVCLSVCVNVMTCYVGAT